MKRDRDLDGIVKFLPGKKIVVRVRERICERMA